MSKGHSETSDTGERKCHIGYNSPLEAMKNGPREKLAYVTCVSAKWKSTNQPDFLATVDLDPESETFSKIIHKLEMPNVGDELHHMGWNACSSCKICTVRRDKLVVPGLNSDRIYIVDTTSDPKQPRIFKVIEPSVLHEKAAVGAPHTVHCLPSGNIMISCMGDADGNGKSAFLLLDQNFEVKGTWQSDENSTGYNYDYWYQPRHNIMVSTEWAAPNTFRNGFHLRDVENGLYGHSITFWDWTEKKPIQKLDLGEKGQIPLEVRFLHNPDADQGFVGCALSTSVFRFKREENKNWIAECVLMIPPKKVKNWLLPEMPGLITDILISLDDRFLYVSNWLHGDVRQYDISDTLNPRCVGQIFLGGSLCKNEKVEVIEDTEMQEQPVRPTVRGSLVRGGPQMLQLSLDGERLYVTNSLFSAWDEQFYPENIEKGSMMVLLHVDKVNGGLSLDQNFIVDFGVAGNILAHEMRFPGGDCTSDIWE
ncbi:methanethiol oxidase-like [Uloborus diversus]|uniref:methanethiol oxidase-like n=1 Tax=Uloborus diversus TaxID=327109 RepID=UPI0024092C1F|nr:methanethiol oxidase-like [Uloborus diversus]